MDLATFRMHASHLHLPRTLRREISNRGLYLYLQPGFTEAECARLVALSKKGLPLPKPAPVVQQPQNLPPQFPRPDGGTGPVYVIYQQYPMNPGAYDEDEDEEEEDNTVNWVLPLSLILIIIAIVGALLYLNPSLIPAWFVTLLS